MMIERATTDDIEAIDSLLYEVHDVHATARPDLFKKGEKKYTSDEVRSHILSEDKPVYVVRQDGEVIAHAFIEYVTPTASSLVKVKTMYIDDICVSSKARGKGIGGAIMDDLESLAREQGCQRMLLNVYTFNERATALYASHGMTPLSTHMEKIL